VSDEGLTPPVLQTPAYPEYPSAAVRDHVQGDVYIEAVVRADGTVADAEVIHGLPDEELNRRALVAILKWRFEPALKGGQPVPVIALFTITYRLR
jgi:TonB family protein